MSGTELMIPLACVIVDGVDTRVSTHILRTQLGLHDDEPHLELRQQLEKVSCISVVHPDHRWPRERGGCAIFLRFSTIIFASLLASNRIQSRQSFMKRLAITIAKRTRWNLETVEKAKHRLGTLGLLWDSCLYSICYSSFGRTLRCLTISEGSHSDLPMVRISF